MWTWNFMKEKWGEMVGGRQIKKGKNGLL